jgi:hypothetical protein
VHVGIPEGPAALFVLVDDADTLRLPEGPAEGPLDSIPEQPLEAGGPARGEALGRAVVHCELDSVIPGLLEACGVLPEFPDDVALVPAEGALSVADSIDLPGLPTYSSFLTVGDAPKSRPRDFSARGREGAATAPWVVCPPSIPIGDRGAVLCDPGSAPPPTGVWALCAATAAPDLA